MKFDNKTLMLVTAGIIVLAGAYWYFFTGSPSDSAPLTATQVAGSEAELKFQSLVSQLSSISFSTTLFNDPKFQSLVDLNTPITPEALGRNDPFAPYGVGSK